MGGKDITPAELQRYMFDPATDKQTAYMIPFQRFSRDGWDHSKQECTSKARFSNDPCDDDPCNSRCKVRVIKKRKQLLMVAMDIKAGPNILLDQEVFISYGEVRSAKRRYQ